MSLIMAELVIIASTNTPYSYSKSAMNIIVVDLHLIFICLLPRLLLVGVRLPPCMHLLKPS